MNRKFRSAILCMSLALPFTVSADAPVQGTMQAFVVESKKGKEILTAAEQVEPDQLVEYHLTYVNSSKDGISGLTVTGPVPEGTTYVTDTAKADVTARFRVSIDGGATFEEEPVIREVVQENGEVKERIVPADEYTHLQWQSRSQLEGKGGKQLYRYRVRVK